jgi:hypothetical protein
MWAVGAFAWLKMFDHVELQPAGEKWVQDQREKIPVHPLFSAHILDIRRLQFM